LEGWTVGRLEGWSAFDQQSYGRRKGGRACTEAVGVESGQSTALLMANSGDMQVDRCEWLTFFIWAFMLECNCVSSGVRAKKRPSFEHLLLWKHV
jgi:hypothetical protein